jgi:hypothetical protein
LELKYQFILSLSLPYFSKSNVLQIIQTSGWPVIPQSWTIFFSMVLLSGGREQFWPKKGNLRCTRKNGQNFTPLGPIKMGTRAPPGGRMARRPSKNA